MAFLGMVVTQEGPQLVVESLKQAPAKDEISTGELLYHPLCCYMPHHMWVSPQRRLCSIWASLSF